MITFAFRFLFELQIRIPNAQILNDFLSWEYGIGQLLNDLGLWGFFIQCAIRSLVHLFGGRFNWRLVLGWVQIEVFESEGTLDSNCFIIRLRSHLNTIIFFSHLIALENDWPIECQVVFADEWTLQHCWLLILFTRGSLAWMILLHIRLRCLLTLSVNIRNHWYALDRAQLCSILANPLLLRRTNILSNRLRLFDSTSIKWKFRTITLSNYRVFFL